MTAWGGEREKELSSLTSSVYKGILRSLVGGCKSPPCDGTARTAESEDKIAFSHRVWWDPGHIQVLAAPPPPGRKGLDISISILI